MLLETKHFGAYSSFAISILRAILKRDVTQPTRNSSAFKQAVKKVNDE